MSLESSQSNLGGPNFSGYKAEESAAFEPLFETVNFDDFDREMDERVDRLVGLWVHLAAPNAGRGRRLFATVGNPTISKPKKNASGPEMNS